MKVTSRARNRTKSKSNHSSFEQESWFKELTNEHPVQAAILARILHLTQSCLSERTAQISPQEIVARLVAAEPAIAELESYLIEPRNKLPMAQRKAEIAEEAKRWAEAYLQMGGDVVQITTTVQDVLSRNPRGRPANNRILARGPRSGIVVASFLCLHGCRAWQRPDWMFRKHQRQ